MVFALASDGSAVKHLDVSNITRAEAIESKKAAFTAYDIWCAGATPDTFGVIQLQEVDTYKALLLRSRRPFDPYVLSKAPNALDELRGQARRTMNPGASNPEEHYVTT